MKTFQVDSSGGGVENYKGAHVCKSDTVLLSFIDLHPVKAQAGNGPLLWTLLAQER
jgi:hypothetical protein